MSDKNFSWQLKNNVDNFTDMYEISIIDHSVDIKSLLKEAMKEAINKGGFSARTDNIINNGKKMNRSVLEIKHYNYKGEEKFAQFELYANNQLKLELF